MSGLQLNNAVPMKSPSTIKTTLPSFDDLLKSLEEPSTVNPHHLQHHHHAHPHHTHQHVMHPPYPHLHHHTHHHHYRPPSTPPTPRLSLGDSSEEDSISSSSSRSCSRHGASARKRRSNSLPSISRTHMKSPFRESSVLPHSIEHHTNRIQKLKEGDGEWAPYSLNAVAPSSLPYSAARSTTLPPTFLDGIDPLGGFGYSPTSSCSSSSTSKRNEILLTPPPSPPLHPIPLPHPTEINHHPHHSPDADGDTSSKDERERTLTTQYKRTFDSVLHLESLHQHLPSAKRQCFDNTHSHDNTNQRLWHFIGEKGCHLHAQFHCHQSHGYRPEHGHVEHHPHQQGQEKEQKRDSVVAEAILMHMLRVGDKRAWSMM